MSAATVSPIRSIQGERDLVKAATSAYREMKVDEVDDYVRKASDGVVACRERGRHLYEATRRRGGGTARGGEIFTEEDSDGYLIRRLRCVCCKLVDRIERWETRREHGQLRYRFVDSRPHYRTDTKEQYLAPSGCGHIRPRTVRESLVTDALSGMSVTEVKKLARHGGKTKAK